MTLLQSDMRTGNSTDARRRTDRSSGPAGVTRAGSMIGRVEEFEAIVTAASCAREQGCALVVEGHPGIGKTCLLYTSDAADE